MAQEGRKNGQGSFSWADRSSYEVRKGCRSEILKSQGGFRDNEINGEGLYIWASPTRFEPKRRTMGLLLHLDPSHLA